jgi:hypothetical protein
MLPCSERTEKLRLKGWMALRGVGYVRLGGDDGVKKWSEERWADAVFALRVKLQALRRDSARYVVCGNRFLRNNN